MSELQTFTCKDSSMIQTVEWAEEEGLTVQFKNGRRYRYSDAPEDVFAYLLECEETGYSVGKAFVETVRNVYAYEAL